MNRDNLILAIFSYFLIVSCSIIETDKFDYSTYDSLFGIDDSGRLKREIHYGSSEDNTVNSDIVYNYNGDGSLKEKIYNDFLGGSSSYILQKDTFYYQNGKLYKMVHFFRQGSTTSPLAFAEVTFYSNPDDDTQIEVTYKNTGEIEDSIVFHYANGLLNMEEHFKNGRNWEKVYEYNSEGKLLNSTELPGGHIHKNFFDGNGLLKRSESWVGEEFKMEYLYERKENNNELIIKKFTQNPNSNKKEISSQTTYVDGKLIEYIRYHPTFRGSEWWCNRYEYH